MSEIDWKDGMRYAINMTRARAAKLAAWMETEEIKSQLREQLSMRAGELFEMARLLEVRMMQEPTSK